MGCTSGCHTDKNERIVGAKLFTETIKKTLIPFNTGCYDLLLSLGRLAANCDLYELFVC